MSWVTAIAVGAATRGDADEYEKWLPLFEAFEAGAWNLWILGDKARVATIPEIVQVDERRRLHCEIGPAFVWLSDVREYFWHGVSVPERLVISPQTITVAEIDREQNAEVRRVMIERYAIGRGDETTGAGAYIRDAGGERLDHDDRWGTLWRRTVPGDEAIVMLEVVYRSAEPDGSFRRYWLRVHPECRPLLANGELGDPQPLTAHAAVASTFGKHAKDYAPIVET